MSVSQPARFGEDWSDERVQGYLQQITPVGENPDFHLLVVAYKHMRAYDFERFLVFFKAAGHNIGAQGAEGKTILELTKSHEKSAEFVRIIEAALA